MINLTQIDGNVLDLSISPIFREFYPKPYSKSGLIINQFNTGKFPPIPKGRTFLDIGGNIGLFSIFVAPYYDKIILIEPTQEHLDVAKDLVECVGLSDKIDIIGKAYWPHSETVKFNVGRQNSTMNSIELCTLVQDSVITVDCITLEILFKQYPDIDFIKMDIEGAENSLYDSEDFKNVLKSKNLLMEVHSFPDLQLENIKLNLEKIRLYLENIGMNTISVNIDELYMTNA